MNRTKSIFAVISVSVIMSLLAACGGSVPAPANVPMIADMKQISGTDNVSNVGKPLPDDGYRQFVGAKFDTAGNFNWSKTFWETPKSFEETKEFYSQKALEAAGWDAPDMPSCTEAGESVMCLVAKPTGDTFTVLVVAVANEKGKAQLGIFHVEGMKAKTE